MIGQLVRWDEALYGLREFHDVAADSMRRARKGPLHDSPWNSNMVSDRLRVEWLELGSFNKTHTMDIFWEGNPIEIMYAASTEWEWHHLTFIPDDFLTVPRPEAGL